MPTATNSPSERQARQVEQLEGGRGRGVFFRPQRYSRSELANVRPVIELTTPAGDRSEPTLHDVSQNGIAFAMKGEAGIEIGAALPQLVVSFDGYEAYHGGARVASVRKENGVTIVGAEFVDSLMNIDDVLQLRDVRLQGRGGSAGLQLAHPRWRVEGHREFKALVSELRLFLEDAAQQMEELERALPWHIVHSETDSPARAGLIRRIEVEFVPEVVGYATRLSAALRLASPDAWQKLKEFSRRQVHEILMQSPWMQRALHKPLGYPGDFEVMRSFYERNFEGPTLFARAISLAFMRTPAGLAVLARKDLLRDFLLGHVRECRSVPPRILSIAAGPAQEVFELVGKLGPEMPPVEIVLFDQDHQALSYAFSRLQRQLEEHREAPLRFVYLHDSIKRLLTDPHLFDECGPFDAIVCAGLFDYLRAPAAIALCRSLYRSLAPGGSLYVGNMVPENPSRWLMEHHLDWFLTYRTRDELLELAREGAGEGEVSLLEEVTGVNPFAKITRPV